MTVTITKIGATKCQVYFGEESIYCNRNSLDIYYNQVNNTLTVTSPSGIQGTRTTTEPLSNVTIQGVVITDKATLDTQVALLWA